MRERKLTRSAAHGAELFERLVAIDGRGRHGAQRGIRASVVVGLGRRHDSLSAHRRAASRDTRRASRERSLVAGKSRRFRRSRGGDVARSRAGGSAGGGSHSAGV